MSSLESGWRELRLKHVVRSNPTKAEIKGLSDDLPVSFVPMEAVGEYGGLDLTQERPLGDVSSGYTYFKDGDVVVAKITPCFENGKGALAQGLRSGIGFGTTELHVLRPQDVHARFLFYLSISDRFRKLGEASMYGAGGQKRISEDFVEEYRAAIPPLDVQRGIASFLDRETARIDTLIEKKRRLLDLLEEKRTALITRAVTRGLDADVPMKDSGVEWIGEIPEHWDVTTLNRITCSSRPIRYGIVLPGPHDEQGVPIIKAGDVARLNGRVGSLRRCGKKIEAKHKQSRVYPGDLVYSIRGSFGAVNRVPEKLPVANLTQDTARVVPEGVSGHWLLFMLRSETVKRQLEAGVKGTAVKGVNIEDLRRAVIPVPPSADQEAISQYLEQELNKLRTMQGKTVEAATLLDEYRAAIVSAAVTGRMNVSS